MASDGMVEIKKRNANRGGRVVSPPERLWGSGGHVWALQVSRDSFSFLCSLLPSTCSSSNDTLSVYRQSLLCLLLNFWLLKSVEAMLLCKIRENVAGRDESWHAASDIFTALAEAICLQP